MLYVPVCCVFRRVTATTIPPRPSGDGHASFPPALVVPCPPTLPQEQQQLTNVTFAAALTPIYDICCVYIYIHTYRQGAIGEAKFIRTLRQIENEAIQAPSAKAGATPLSEEVKSCSASTSYSTTAESDFCRIAHVGECFTSCSVKGCSVCSMHVTLVKFGQCITEINLRCLL